MSKLKKEWDKNAGWLMFVSFISIIVVYLTIIALSLLTKNWHTHITRPDCSQYTVNQYKSGETPQACVKGETNE